MNEVLIEDSTGEVVDIHEYCSDFCAKTDPAYAGWYGCQEVDFDTVCAHCGTTIAGILSPADQLANS